MQTPEELGVGYQNAVDAGDIPAANEFAAALNALESGNNAKFVQKQQPATSADNNPITQQGWNFKNNLSVEPSVVSNAIRFGVPMAAGVALAPETAGLSIPAAMLLMSTTGAVSGGLSQALADKIEGKDLSLKDISSAAILNATPFLDKGGILTRAAVNVPSAIGSSELARFISHDPNSKEESTLKRFGTPAGLASLMSMFGGKGESVGKAFATRDVLQAERRGGTVMIGEMIPEQAAFEANRVLNNSKLANELMSNMDINIGEAVLKEFPEAQSTQHISDYLSAMSGQLSKTQNDWRQATRAADEATQAAQQAVANNAENAPALIAKANEAAMEQSKSALLHQGAISSMFRGKEPNLGELAEGVRTTALREVATNAKTSLDSAIDDLYLRAGVRPNTPVISLGDVKKLIRDQSKQGGAFEDNTLRKNTLDRLQNIFGGATALDSATLSRNDYRNLQSTIAKDLTKEGYDIKTANKIAGDLYNTTRGASDAFMERSNPSTFADWKIAQSAAAAKFNATKAGAIDSLINGDITTLLKNIKREGAKGDTMRELEAYGNVLAGTFDRNVVGADVKASQAATIYSDKIYKALGSALVDESLVRTNGMIKDFRNVDFESLAKNVQSLASSGVNVERMGLGTASQIRLLAKLATKTNGVTVEEFNQILNEVPSVGIDTAFAKMQHYRNIRDNLILGGAKKSGNIAAEALRISKAAKLTESETFAAYDKASRDPLVVFMDGTKAKLSADPANNAQWVDRILSLPPSTASGLMENLVKSGRGADASILSDAAAERVLHDFGSIATGSEGRVNLKSISDFFNPKLSDKLATFAAVVGPEKMKNIQNNFIAPINNILRYRALANNGASDMQLLNQARFRQGNGMGGSVVTSIGQAFSLLQEGRYKLLNYLYLNPTSSAMYRQAGNDLDKFIAKSPVNAIQLRLAMQDDEKKPMFNVPNAPAR